MKKHILLILLLIICTAVISCGKAEETDKSNDNIVNEEESLDDNKIDEEIDTEVEGKKADYDKSLEITDGILYDAMIGLRDGDYGKVYPAIYNSTGIEPDLYSFRNRLEYTMPKITEDFNNNIEQYSNEDYETVVLQSDDDVNMMFINDGMIIDQLDIPLSEDNKLIIERIMSTVNIYLPSKASVFMNGSPINVEAVEVEDSDKDYRKYCYTLEDVLQGEYTLSFDDTILSMPNYNVNPFLSRENYDIKTFTDMTTPVLKEDVNESITDLNIEFFNGLCDALRNNLDISFISDDTNTLSDEQKETLLIDFLEKMGKKTNKEIERDVKFYHVNTSKKVMDISDTKFAMNTEVESVFDGFNLNADFRVTYIIDNNGIKISNIE